MPGFLGGSSGSSGSSGEITFPKEFIDPVTKLRVSQPENLIDTDFEYGLQPTKWETVELINNTPSFFSKSGDTTIPGIVSIATNSGTREITVTTATEHGLAVGIPINVTGTKSVTADGSYVINSIPNTSTFTYLCKDEQTGNNAIEDLYTSIITGEFFQGSQIRIADAEGVITDAEPVSTLTVKTDSTHGFGLNTPFYFLNLNSTISQEFEASNTAAKSFDSSNSATAQTFDGSNTLSTFNIDWSNSATVAGTTSTISSVDTVNDTITVTHGAETFASKPLGTPLYYNLSVAASSGYFLTNPRGVVFLKTTTALNNPAGTSIFQVSATPDGDAIDIVSSMSGTFQLANQARTFAGNNVDPANEVTFTVVENAVNVFDGANTLGSTSTVSLFSGTTVQMQNDAGSGVNTGLYVGAMVFYNTTGSAASGLTNNTTYFVRSLTNIGGLQGLVQITIGALPDSTTAITISGGSGTQTFKKIGVSIDKDIFHVPGNDYITGSMLRYRYPAGGAVARTGYSSDYMYVQTRYADGYNLLLKDTKGSVPTGLDAGSPGVSAEQLKIDNGYNTDGVYYITINGTAEPVYCIMNSAISGGGWMMAMKATRGNTFSYDSSYWTSNNTLNTAQYNRNDGDAKFNVMNYWQTKDILALWPDIGQGGSLNISGYPWIWLQNNWYNSGQRISPISFFGSQSNVYVSNPFSFSGMGSPFSAQGGAQWYGFNYTLSSPNAMRWGFGWNNEGTHDSNDVEGGLGSRRAGFSAGDAIYCCQTQSGINRSARVELYVR